MTIQQEEAFNFRAHIKHVVMNDPELQNWLKDLIWDCINQGESEHLEEFDHKTKPISREELERISKEA